MRRCNSWAKPSITGYRRATVLLWQPTRISSRCRVTTGSTLWWLTRKSVPSPPGGKLLRTSSDSADVLRQTAVQIEKARRRADPDLPVRHQPVLNHEVAGPAEVNAHAPDAERRAADRRHRQKV